MSNAGYGNHDEPPPAAPKDGVASLDAPTPDTMDKPKPVHPPEGATVTRRQGDEVDPGLG